tara:strand:+ start:170 stop:370 length:201 start_codon:yes stop_codon:yes gene_type:complete
MGYFKRNRIVYHGVKGERIYSNSMKRKKKRVYLGAESYEDQKVKDFFFALGFLSIGVVCILTIILL